MGLLIPPIIFFIILFYLFGIAFLGYRNPLRISKTVAIVLMVIIFFILPVPAKGIVIVISFITFILLRLKLDKKIIKFIKELDSDRK